ncbi:MAG: hypothetical protein Q9214_006642, partial [Letrouitia sp. 1 TL-2023]
YISRTHDPFINLSIEHYLLQKSHVDSTILFLYVNRPCIVIGRNQNPWLEVDHRMLKNVPAIVGSPLFQNENPGTIREEVVLVRRRSGGGTVFHDFGNVNYSVICPNQNFNRDKHAEMVVRAIRKINRRARVNDRHDIVLDSGPLMPETDRPDPYDTHKTAYSPREGNTPPRKVSGSAYKLTRQRSLHHGTCLLASPNISTVSGYLKSPAKPFLKARGVESVRSPIANVLECNENIPDKVSAFELSIVDAFTDMYGLHDCKESIHQGGMLNEAALPHIPIRHLDESVERIPEIEKGIDELKSMNWLYGQTPQFTLSSHVCEEDDRKRPPLPTWLDSDYNFQQVKLIRRPRPIQARIFLKIKSGIVISSQISTSSGFNVADAELNRALVDIKVFQVDSFKALVELAGPPQGRESKSSDIAAWLDLTFGK